MVERDRGCGRDARASLWGEKETVAAAADFQAVTGGGENGDAFGFCEGFAGFGDFSRGELDFGGGVGRDDDDEFGAFVGDVPV